MYPQRMRHNEWQLINKIHWLTLSVADKSWLTEDTGRRTCTTILNICWVQCFSGHALMHVTSNLLFYYAPRSKIGGQIVCVLFLSRLSFCHSENMSETWSLLITLERWKIELWSFKEHSFWQYLSVGTNIFTTWSWPWSLTYVNL